MELRRGKWAVVWWEGGERHRRSTGSADEKVARRFQTDFEAQMEVRPVQLGMADAFDRYVDSRRGKISALKQLEEAIVPLNRTMGHLRVDQVDQRARDRYAATRVRKPTASNPSPTPVSPGTLRRELKVLLDACATEHVRAFMAIAIYTGARKESILALTWDRVHRETGMIDKPITGKRRSIVRMTKALRREMETAHANANGPYVVQCHGRAVPTGLRWSFAKACERAGLSWKPTPHHLKHSVASWFAMDRVPIDQAADWLATDPTTLRRVYRKSDPTYLRSIADDFEL
ncbi:tyrosine-type recombinase/integrase [Gluconacetobacter sp. Hr-1-5]|uniref:tyrosine-type recombinase/integrase n=1 Tax=Gluconacetobacter sp. Hr-1-5 TaxID=3395370 RepID=UPI003B5221FC